MCRRPPYRRWRQRAWPQPWECPYTRLIWVPIKKLSIRARRVQSRSGRREAGVNQHGRSNRRKVFSGSGRSMPFPKFAKHSTRSRNRPSRRLFIASITMRRFGSAWRASSVCGALGCSMRYFARCFRKEERTDCRERQPKLTRKTATDFSPPWQGGAGGVAESAPQSGKVHAGGDQGRRINTVGGHVASDPPNPPLPRGGEELALRRTAESSSGSRGSVGFAMSLSRHGSQGRYGASSFRISGPNLALATNFGVGPRLPVAHDSGGLLASPAVVQTGAVLATTYRAARLLDFRFAVGCYRTCAGSTDWFCSRWALRVPFGERTASQTWLRSAI